GDELAVDHEDEVEQCLFGLPGTLDVPVDVDARVAGDLRVEPRVLLTGAPDTNRGDPEFQLSISHVRNDGTDLVQRPLNRAGSCREDDRRALRGLGAVADAELAIERGGGLLDAVGADVQSRGDLAVGRAGAEQDEDLPLAVAESEAGGWGGRGFQRCAGDDGGADRGDDIVPGDAGGEEADRAEACRW